MIDFETELRQHLDHAASDVRVSPDLLGTIERRARAQGRRAVVVRVAGALVVVALAAGIALVATGVGDDEEGGTTMATDPTGTTTGPETTLVPPEPPAVVSSGTWGTMAEAPIPHRSQHVAVDMDGEVFVWSGNGVEGEDLARADAAVYDTSADTWRSIPDAPLSAGNSAGAWTGSAVVAVAIDSNDGASPYEAAAFDPATDTWSAIAEPPTSLDRDGIPTLVATGSQVVLLSSVGGAEPRAEVAIYDPATDTWAEGADSPSGAGFGADPTWTGSEVVIVGSRPDDPAGTDPTAVTALLLAYDPAGDTWRELPWDVGTDRRWAPALAWTGTHLFAGGGQDASGGLADGALVDLATGTWTALPDAPEPYVGLLHGDAAVWTGAQVVVLSDQQGSLAGAPLAYEVATGGWSQGPTAPDGPRPNAPAVWSADRVVVPVPGTVAPTDDGFGLCCVAGTGGGLTYTP